ncbi:MAG: hypothetical protein FP816_06000 [Desulfobacteraceae bacterium]|nr:hypothetical protein [Desulfobacteraceae bacterium]MBU4001478.1 hypothetical protein [Pseudomonadota bacterium]MBU4053210.1 hypothetical protein [Pseudomonadota bacterium]
MASDPIHPTRNQKIFDLGLSVETVSLYLLCCGLTDEGRRVSFKEIQSLWNSSEEALQSSLADLEKRNILRKILSDQDGHGIYGVMGPDKWGLSPV